jgi:uncharacterized protein
MEFRGLEASLIEVLSASELQRLRRIRQLGLVHLVFPAAEHSRLVHSLGAAHVAMRFARRLENATADCLAPALRPDEETRRDLALAALCHDLGHGPLSHVWEQEVVANFNVDAWAEKLGLNSQRPWSGMQWHELVGQGILLDKSTEIHRLLSRQESGLPKRIAALLRGEYHLDYITPLLSSDIDVDRCDFVLRDAQQAGVAYGRFDLDWLISIATVGAVDHGRLVVGFDYEKAPRVIEQFLVARRALYDTVYRHRTARSAEGMVGLLLRRIADLLKDEKWILGDDDQSFTTYKRALAGQPIGVHEILALDDYSLWVFIMTIGERGKDETAKDLAQRIVRRDLFKLVRVDSMALNRHLVNGLDMMSEIVETACGVKNGRSYLVFDQFPFSTFSADGADGVYLVEAAGKGPGKATLAKNHPQLRDLQSEGDESIALYAPEEAVDGLAAQISR